MREVALASFACLVVPLIGVSFRLKGELQPPDRDPDHEPLEIRPWHQWLMLIAGLSGLLFVPAFKAYTHLPPYIGMILSLGVLWVISEMISHTMDERTLQAPVC